ncbi:tyrosine--tRNA ligase [Candidatus Saccharibacteria bacterium]|nr:MAG: tyrosine--tRNA ligase [Candidatus Saccharibacteria bacterium]
MVVDKRGVVDFDGRDVCEMTFASQQLIPEDGVLKSLDIAKREKRRLRIKMGFDPTSADLHLGHAVPMMQLKRFQEAGHLPVVIIGDFTGRIGDPSGRNKSRPVVSPEALIRNASTYVDQLGKILDVSDIEIHYNSEWLGGMNLSRLIDILSRGSLSQIISRDDFRKRISSGSTIGLHEIIYPYLQGLDSVEVDADIEVGGIDQLYACQAARTLQKSYGRRPEALVLTPLLTGTDGSHKMSKSLGNYIGLNDLPSDMFGKVMSIPDSLIEEYIRLASSFDPQRASEYIRMLSEVSSNPMEVKLDLAYNIVETYHGSALADQALEFFNNQFRKGGKKSYITVEVDKPSSLPDLLVKIGAAKSRSDARRLIVQGAVKINSSKVSDIGYTIDSYDNVEVSVGKLRFYRLVETGR